MRAKAAQQARKSQARRKEASRDQAPENCPHCEAGEAPTHALVIPVHVKKETLQ